MIARVAIAAPIELAVNGLPVGAITVAPALRHRSARRISAVTTMLAAPLFHSWGFAHFTLGMALRSTLVLRRKFDPEAVKAINALGYEPIYSTPEQLQAQMRSDYDNWAKIVKAAGISKQQN